ncbi:hypothetical protein DFR29_10283 [Tahibacter aquaticus]|uniref:MSHA biogenesis protein MshK n=1 Tax=Tahibacter aquaticus TaxID=520092 RepID=A0A4R6Z6T4_9GAMM|nr:hypothetical protein [Tahibacter aquaticus]TDR47424.1 hypothetical protein DFR29_10283 [Tahibacter aquaticus]
MRALMVVMLAAASMDVAAADPSEAKIDQLMSAAAKPAAARPAEPKAAKAKANEPDSATSLVGQRVAVTTRSNGLYLGTLTSVTRDALVLAIELPSRNLSYSVPRSSVASISPR